MDEKKSLLSKLGSALVAQPGLDDLLVLSSHASGFKRENAVRRLGMLGNPIAIPYLIERVNDWVPQVRAAARDALSRFLIADHAAAWVASLPAVMHLQTCGRDDHSGLLRTVEEFLLRDENSPQLVTALHSQDIEVARLAIRLLVDRRQAMATKVVAAGLVHTDVVVRSTVVDLLRGLEAAEFAAAVATALRDPYMPVRREAFQQLLSRDAAAGLRVARDMLFDAAASIREIAVRRLLHAGEPVEQIYSHALMGDKDRVAVVACVLWSWAYLNNHARSEQVRQLLGARFPAVRRAALQTIAKLLRNCARSDVVAALADESPAVSKEAARLTTRMDDKPGAEELVSIARASARSHVAVACCRVARYAGKWEWLKVILKVYGAVDAPVTREMFASEIDAWEHHFNRSSAQPDKDSVSDIVAALSVCEPKLSADQTKLLKFTLRSYGAEL